MPPTGDGAAESLHLWRAGVVLEIDTELGDELGGQLRVVDGVDTPHNFFGAPYRADLTIRVTRFEQTAQLRRRSCAMVINLRTR